MILQYLVNLKAQRAFARDDGDIESVQIIDVWFDSFKEALRDVFENRELNLEFDRQALNFLIVDGNKKYTFNSLSSGQSAILSIYAELLLRVEAAANGKKNIGGLILIDEPETHLHASLQKKILSFLVKTFPQFQFVVTTHSPFIISSLKNTKILNLEDGKTYEDFSSFSYEAILEEYMQVDKYSIDVKREVESIKDLLTSGDKQGAQAGLDDLLAKLTVSEFSVQASAELALELSSIKLALNNIE
nr:AAA family ATPase [Pseudomonas yamanorum]